MATKARSLSVIDTFISCKNLTCLKQVKTLGEVIGGLHLSPVKLALLPANENQIKKTVVRSIHGVK